MRAWPKKTILQAAGGTLLVLLTAGVTWWLLQQLPKASAPQTNSTATIQQSDKKLEECAGKHFDCYNEYLTTRTKIDGSAAAMADLRHTYTTDDYVKSQCHQLTHIVGREAARKYGTVKKAFQHGDSFCWSGYHHGVVEAAIQDIGAEKIRAQTNDICSGFAAAKQYSFDHYNCVHGMGHGFMAVAELNLFTALKDCDILTNSWERTSCYGGVFMENVMIEARGEGKSAYLKPDQPMYPCTAVEKQYKEQCYLMQTSYALQQNQYNFADVFNQCAALTDAEFIATCYQSIGRDASGSTVSDIARTKANCSPAPNQDALNYCVLGAVRDFISYYHSDEQAKQFCNAFDMAVKNRCLEEVKTYYATFR